MTSGPPDYWTSRQFTWRVKKSEHGTSLENFIYRQLGDWSHGRVKQAIDAKRAFVNGRNVFISKWNVKAGDRITFAPGGSGALRGGGRSGTGGRRQGVGGGFGVTALTDGRYRFVEVLFEDTHVLVTSKPAFIDFETYVRTVQDYLRRQNKGHALPYLGQMHRLDKETSGAMVFTKKKIANPLADQFRERRIKKEYLAVVEGQLQREQGVIKKSIEKGAFEEGRKVRIDAAGDTGKDATTEYRVIERYENATLLRVVIKTGRTHQIRIHMSDLGHPVVGDKVYGNPHGIPFKRQALHAEHLEFSHPITHQKIKITAPLPADLRGLLERLRVAV